MNGYGYVEDIPHLNKEEVLTRVTQQEIFSMVVECQLGRFIVSPFRRDDNPGAYFDWHGHKLLFIDFGDPIRTHRDCFNAIQDTYNIGFNEALIMIDNHFNLGLGSGEVAVAERLPLPSRAVRVLRNRTDIIYSRRRFVNADRLFWEPYGISSTQLMQDETIPIVWYKFHSHRLNKEIICRPRTVCYAYTFEENVKLYTPHASGRDVKWVSNCNTNDVGFIDELPVHGRKLTITKSYKDCRILRNMGVEAIWFQNEGMIPDDQILLTLCRRFDNIFVLFDSDQAGSKASIKVVGKINSMFPNKVTPVFFSSGGKDTGEFIINKGKAELLKFLNYNQMM